MTFKKLAWLTLGGSVTALGAVAGYRWKTLEMRRVELNKEYIELLQQIQLAEEEKQGQVRALRDKEKAADAMQQTINNIWSDRLARYVETNEDLLAYIKALPESLRVLHGLTNHYNYMSAIAREFISFDVSCIKVHILSLLLEHAKRVCNGHYCQEMNCGDNKSKASAESDVLNHRSDKYVEHKMKSVWTTLRELYTAEPVIVAVCDSFLLDTSASCESDRMQGKKLQNSNDVNAERTSSFSDNGDRRIPSSLHEVSETFNYCLDELEKKIMQSQERNNSKDVMNRNTVNNAQVHSTSDDNYKLTDTNESNTSKVYLTDNNNNNSNDNDNKSIQGSVTGDIIRSLAEIVHVDEMTPAERAMMERRHEQEQRIKRERRQLKTRDDVEAALVYSSELLSTIDTPLCNKNNTDISEIFTSETNSPLQTLQSSTTSTLENKEPRNESTSTHVLLHETCTDPAIHQAMEQIRIWQEAATAYLIQSQSLDILDCYSALLAETLTHVHSIEEQEAELHEQQHKQNENCEERFIKQLHILQKEEDDE